MKSLYARSVALTFMVCMVIKEEALILTAIKSQTQT